MSEEPRLPIPAREKLGSPGVPQNGSGAYPAEAKCAPPDKDLVLRTHSEAQVQGSKSLELPIVPRDKDTLERRHNALLKMQDASAAEGTSSWDLSRDLSRSSSEKMTSPFGQGGGRWRNSQSEDNLLWKASPCKKPLPWTKEEEVGCSVDSDSDESCGKASSSDHDAAESRVASTISRKESKGSNFKFLVRSVEHTRSEPPGASLRRRGSFNCGLGLSIEVCHTRSERTVTVSVADADDGWDLPGPAPRCTARARRRQEEDDREAVEQVRKMNDMLLQQHAQVTQQRISRRSRRLHTAPSLVSSPSTSSPRPTLEVQEDERLQPIVIFDWDDTLFPTWFVTEVIQANMPPEHKFSKLSEDSPHYEALKCHAELVRETLHIAAAEARVGIVTLAARPWVGNSAEWFLPGLDMADTLESLNIPVFYAREHVRKFEKLAARVEGVDLFTIAKRNAMKTCLRRLCPRAEQRGNVICIGDSTTEVLAIKEIMWSEDGGTAQCKTIKLLDDPNLEVLTMELKLVKSWFSKMIPHNEDFDICLSETGKKLVWE